MPAAGLLAAASAVALLVGAIPALVPNAASAEEWAPDSTALVSVSTQSVQGDVSAIAGQGAVWGISEPQASADGRVVVWASAATTVAQPAPTNARPGLFVRDNVTGITRRVDVSNGGQAPLGQPGAFALSADGQWLAFGEDPSGAPNGDPILLADLEAGTVEQIGSGTPAWMTISDDGGTVAYNLGGGAPQVRVHDAASGDTESVVVGNGVLRGLSMSGDGGTLAFLATSTNLAPDNPAPAPGAGTTSLYTVGIDGDGLHRVLTPSGALPDADDYGLAGQGAFTTDAGLLTFSSDASNWSVADLNGNDDVFVLDRATGAVTTESRRSVGDPGSGVHPTISADGARLAFRSDHAGVVAGDTNDAADAFVKDRGAGTIERVDVAADGAQVAAGIEGRPLLTGDGDHVLYVSAAEDLVLGDANLAPDVFLATLPGGTGPALTGVGLPQGAHLSWVDPPTDFGGVILEYNPGVGAPLVPGEGTAFETIEGSSAHVTDVETGGDSLAFALFTKNAAQVVVSRKVVVVLPVPTPPQATATSIKRSASTVTYGRKVTLSGVVTSAGVPASDIKVSLQRRLKGTLRWYTLGSTVTGLDGGWSRAFVPSQSADYRVLSTNPGYLQSMSVTTSVSVRYKVTASVTKAKAKKGKKSTVTARISPKAIGKPVALQKWSKGKWRTVGTKKSTSSSRATFTVKPAKKGSWTYRVHRDATRVVLAGDSATFRIKRT